MRRLVALVGVAAASWSPAAFAQDVRPGDERIELPGFQAPEDEARAREPLLAPLPAVPDFIPDVRPPGEVLPAIPPERPGEPAAAVVRTVRIEGNTVLPDALLARIASSVVGRPIDAVGLVDLRDRITLAYIDAGYVTSGAVLDATPMVDGVVTLRVVEGRLARVEIENAGRLRDGYLRARLALGTQGALDVRTLSRNLARLQRSEQIASVHGELKPGDRPGEAVLHVAVSEASPWRLGMGVNDGNSPSIGEWRGELSGGSVNVTGAGDALSGGFRVSGGMVDLRAAYAIAISARDTAFTAHYRQTWTEVTEDPIARFDISSRIATYGAGLKQPLLDTDATRLDVFAVFEWRRSRSFLADEPFSFLPGPQEGVATVAPLRLGGDLTWRSAREAVAARMQLSVGLPVLGSTQNPSDVPDARFVAWLGQAQYARRLTQSGLEVLVRAEAQVASQPLLSMEQFALGGFRTIRGYRENFVVRDNGAVGSLELRIPLATPRVGDWKPRVSVAPFVDSGHGWSASDTDVPDETLLSAGVGTRIVPFEGALFELFWGMRLLDDTGFPDDALQDHGVYLSLSWRR